MQLVAKSPPFRKSVIQCGCSSCSESASQLDCYPKRKMIVNKNVVRSRESRILGDKFYCQLVLLCRFFIWNTKRVLYVNVNTQKVKIARRNRPHILASHRCEAFETSCILILLQWGEFFQGFTLKKLNDDFYQYKEIYFSKIQLGVCYQCCDLIGWATNRHVIAY